MLQFQKLKELRDEVMKKRAALDKLTSRYTRLLENKPETVQQHISPVKVNTVYFYSADLQYFIITCKWRPLHFKKVCIFNKMY